MITESSWSNTESSRITRQINSSNNYQTEKEINYKHRPCLNYWDVKELRLYIFMIPIRSKQRLATQALRNSDHSITKLYPFRRARTVVIRPKLLVADREVYVHMTVTFIKLSQFHDAFHSATSSDLGMPIENINGTASMSIMCLQHCKTAPPRRLSQHSYCGQNLILSKTRFWSH